MMDCLHWLDTPDPGDDCRHWRLADLGSSGQQPRECGLPQDSEPVLSTPASRIVLPV